MKPESPYSPPSFESDQPIRELFAESVWPRLFLSLELLVVVLGQAAAVCISTETIIATGVALGLVGLTLSVVAWQCKDVGLLACGFSGPAFSGCVFLLIFLNGWYPTQARMPVFLLSIAYLFCLLLVAVWLILRHRRNRNAVRSVQ